MKDITVKVEKGRTSHLPHPGYAFSLTIIATMKRIHETHEKHEKKIKIIRVNSCNSWAFFFMEIK
jgi:hypothetical protein